MMVNTTSETSPTPGRDPDLFLANLGGQEASEDWGLAFAAAIGSNEDNNQLPGKIDEAGIFGLTDFASYDSTLNTPTMETQELVWAPLDNTLNNQSIGDIWNFGGGSPLPAELHAVPMHLVEGGLKEDEGYCPSPDSAPMLSSTTVLAPTHPGPSPTAKREVSRERDDLLNWIVNDTIIPTSDMPGEVKEEIIPFEYDIPTTVDDSSILFSDYDRPREASNIGPERLAKRKGRGRPAIPLGRAITPRVSRRKIASGEDSDTVYMTSDGNLTETEAEKMRYRRMRDLNNEASKRCRENRKTKFQILEMEREELFTKNTELRARLTSLESNVRKLKNFYLEHMAAGKELPDPTVMWSMLNMNPNDF